MTHFCRRRSDPDDVHLPGAIGLRIPIALWTATMPDVCHHDRSREAKAHGTFFDVSYLALRPELIEVVPFREEHRYALPIFGVTVTELSKQPLFFLLREMNVEPDNGWCQY